MALFLLRRHSAALIFKSAQVAFMRQEIMNIILAISTFLLALFTAVMAWATLKLANESREASFRQIRVQIWLEFMKRFDSEEMLKARSELAKVIRAYTPDKHNKISEKVMNFFEDVGTAYHGGFIDEKLAYDTFSYHACRWWEASKAYVDHERKLHKEAKDLFVEFEKFAVAIRTPNEMIDADEMKLFLINEQCIAVN